MKDVSKSHPRYKSLMTRELVVRGVEKGITSLHGLIAQGRGEAFDYLLGERTNDFAKRGIDTAAAQLLLSKHPVISVNGNVAALVSEEIVQLGKELDANIEVNIFHTSKYREKEIRKWLKKMGAKKILMPSKRHTLDYIDHNRKYVNKEGILNADVVFVPIEDGDRCEALRRNGKVVITVDLNPISRTSKNANITIVDNIVRVMPLLIRKIRILKKKSPAQLERIVGKYNNSLILRQALSHVKSHQL